MSNKTVSCDFYIENLYDGFDEKPLLALVPKIVDELFKIERIKSEFNYKFDTLSFDILLSDDEKIQQINRDYRQKDCPTDVITFSLFSDDDMKIIHDGTINLGEIIISLDTARSQANEAKHSLHGELILLITHGILHLLGFDHQTDVDYTFIVEIQDKIVKILGVNNEKVSVKKFC